MLNKSVELKVVKDVLIFGGIILGLLCIFCFFGMYDIPLGFLLGLIISLINYAIVNVQTKKYTIGIIIVIIRITIDVVKFFCSIDLV